MSDHAEDHHAAPAKPDATSFMGFAIFLGMVTIVVTLVGSIRDSSTFLTIGLATGIIGIVLAVLAALAAKRRQHTTRGFAVSVMLGACGIVMYLLVASV